MKIKLYAVQLFFSHLYKPFPRPWKSSKDFVKSVEFLFNQSEHTQKFHETTPNARWGRGKWRVVNCKAKAEQKHEDQQRWRKQNEWDRDEWAHINETDHEHKWLDGTGDMWLLIDFCACLTRERH